MAGAKTNLNLSRICPVQTGKTLTNLNLSRKCKLGVSLSPSPLEYFAETKGHSVQAYPSSWPASINSHSLGERDAQLSHSTAHFILSRRYQPDLSQGLTIVYRRPSPDSCPGIETMQPRVCARRRHGTYRFLFARSFVLRTSRRQLSTLWDERRTMPSPFRLHIQNGTALNTPQEPRGILRMGHIMELINKSFGGLRRRAPNFIRRLVGP
jgi:hypothetical protein